MKQNVYDDPAFFTGYQKMRRAPGGPNRLIEVPTMRELIGDVRGKSILDIGCGQGDLSMTLAAEGASSVLGLEISRNMIDRAKRANRSRNVRFEHAAIEDFQAADGAFDLVVSSLCLHYVPDYARLVDSVHNWLRPGGVFVYSIEHPIVTCNPNSWVADEGGEIDHWALDNYRVEGPRPARWIIDGVVVYHRTLETLLQVLLSRGMRLVDLREPEARKNLLPSDADCWPTRRRLDQKRPVFLFVKSEKAPS